MKIETKHLWAIVVILLFVIVGQRQHSKRQARKFTELIGTSTEFKKLKDENAQLRIKYVDREKLLEKSRESFNDLLDTHKRLKALTEATFKVDAKARENGQSDRVYTTSKGQKLLINEIKLDDGPAIGYVLIMQDGKTVSKLYNHEIKVEQVISRDEKTGKYQILSHADFVLKSPTIDSHKWYGKPYRLNVKDATAYVDPTEPIYPIEKSFMWAPRLNMNLVANPKPQAGLSVSLAGYGVSKNDLQYKFLDLGIAYDHSTEKINPTLMPVLIRPLEKYLPNTYVGPGIMLDGMKDYKYFGGLQVGF